MATEKLRAGARLRRNTCKYSFDCRRALGSAVVFCSVPILAWWTMAFAQDVGPVAPSMPAEPPVAPPTFEEEETAEPEGEEPEGEEAEGEEAEEEETEEERTLLPFLLPEPSLTETLMPDSRADLNDQFLFPPDALGGLPRAERGRRIGQFEVSSRVAVSAAYDDNVRASDSDRKDDITGNLGGSVSAQSQFERHSLGFGASASIGNPQNNLDQDTADRIALRAGADGRLDFTPRSSLRAEANVARGAENPEDREAGAQDQPTIVAASTAVAYRQRFNRLGWTLGGGVSRREADDGEDASEQDRTQYTIAPGVDYRLSRRVSLFADTDYSINRYDQSGEGGSRDSQSVGATVGADIGLGRAFAARIGAGYQGVFFDDSERDDKHVPTITAGLDGAFGISLDRLTVLRVSVNHSTEQTTAEDAALVTSTGVGASINRPLTPQSAVLARLDVSRSDFVDDSRTDHDIGAELAYSHTLVRNVALNLAYRFTKRFSNESEDEFYRNIVSVGLSASF